MTRELLTTSDIADALGVTRRRGTAIAGLPDFPKPYARTPHGIRLWRGQDVERFVERWPRRPGRRPLKG